MSDVSMSAYEQRLILENQSLRDEIERLTARIAKVARHKDDKERVHHKHYLNIQLPCTGTCDCGDNPQEIQDCINLLYKYSYENLTSII